MEQVCVDTCDMARVQLGIHPEGFEWELNTGEAFQSPGSGYGIFLSGPEWDEPDLP